MRIAYIVETRTPGGHTSYVGKSYDRTTAEFLAEEKSQEVGPETSVVIREKMETRIPKDEVTA